jgi:cyclophilin family peptidyl-prolyl cis-trans isomerase
MGGPAAAQGGRAGQAPPAQTPLTPAQGNPVAGLTTSLGDITIELFKDKAPVSVENFLQYVKEGFYAGTAFHRVKPGFMIQGGGYAVLRKPGQEGYTLDEKPTRPPIQNEATNELKNTRGTVAMARRAQLRSATSQFYINVVDNPMLDHTGFSPEQFGYAVFGRVLDGMDVVDRIAAVKTKTVGEMADIPVEPVSIKSIVIRN